MNMVRFEVFIQKKTSVRFSYFLYLARCNSACAMSRTAQTQITGAADSVSCVLFTKKVATSLIINKKI